MLKPNQILYFDRFRSQVVHRLGGQVFDEFWLRTVLRESMRDEVIMEAVLGVGALAQALETAPTNIPLFKTHLSSLASNSHYRHGLRHYTAALAKVRQRIEGSMRADDLVQRTILIVTNLFTVFETIHGNSKSVDRLLANGVSVINEKAAQQGPSKSLSKPFLSSRYDDQGAEDAELLLIRRACLVNLYSPFSSMGKDSLLTYPIDFTNAPSPPDIAESSELFRRMYTQFSMMPMIWFVHIEARIKANPAAYYDPQLRQEQQYLLATNNSWNVEAERRLETERDPRTRSLLKQIFLSTKVLKVAYWTAFGTAESTADKIKFKEDTDEIFSLAEALVAETPPAQTGESDIYDGVQAIVIGISQAYHDLAMRARALGLLKRLLNAHSRWAAKAIFMGSSALLAVEEARRGKGGEITGNLKYFWSDAAWSDDYSELRLEFSSRASWSEDGQLEKKKLVLRPKDCDLA